MRSSPSTAKRMSLIRQRLRASAVRARSSSSSSAIRRVIELRGADGSDECMRSLLVDRLGEQRRHRGAFGRLFEGEPDREGRADADVALGSDRAVMALDDLAAQREADAGPRIGARSMQPLEGSEDAGGVLLIESDPVVPVSYTHLRAHETGRNLVCRLLLEKKKK